MFTTSDAAAEDFSSDTMKKYGNIISQKENDNFLTITSQNREYCDLTDKESKIVVMKNSKELQENSERQYNDFRTKLVDKKSTLQKVQFYKDTKNALQSPGVRADQMKERISKLEDRNLEVIQVEEESEQRFFLSEETLQELSDCIHRAKIR